MTLISFTSPSAFGVCSCENIKLFEKSTYERPTEIGLIVDENLQKNLLDAFKILREAGEHVDIFVTEEHGYGGGAYKIVSAKHENQHVSVELKFEADLFSVGTAAMNHRVLFFISEKPCKISNVHILNN